MLANQLANSLQPLGVLGFLRRLRFTTTEGYFVAPHETGQVEDEILPRVRCQHDGAPMYVREVRPKERSFRPWRCPLCSATSTSAQLLSAAM